PQEAVHPVALPLRSEGGRGVGGGGAPGVDAGSGVVGREGSVRRGAIRRAARGEDAGSLRLLRGLLALVAARAPRRGCRGALAALGGTLVSQSSEVWPRAACVRGATCSPRRGRPRGAGPGRPRR